MLMLSLIILIIFIFMGVAFLTMLERKVLGYIQIRKGPNMIFLMGIMQPFSDGVKLFTKEMINPIMSNYLIYYFCPIINLFIALIMWMVIPFFSFFFNFSYSILYILCCSSFMVYSIMLAGWSSNSNYSMLGSVRSIVQMISYEVSLFIIMMSFLVMLMSLKLIIFMELQLYLWFMFLFFPLMMILFVSGLAETNRSPFDFVEGESELVSGFNIEYMSGGFALIFMSEYSNILFMSMLFSIFFLGGDLYSYIFFLKILFLSFMWIWVRGSFPRFRYDKFMYLMWKSFLSVSLNFLLFYLNLKLLIFIL
uniref:NADH-ubiquinone oxidoreductase chain 1 n=1 Tax=Metopiellus crypticus TaxID=3140185 RepID=A0AAT9QHG4_9COLE|nr:NADH dehydrogenase subunit 1 [Metopiellus sp.]